MLLTNAYFVNLYIQILENQYVGQFSWVTCWIQRLSTALTSNHEVILCQDDSRKQSWIANSANPACYFPLVYGLLRVSSLSPPLTCWSPPSVIQSIQFNQVIHLKGVYVNFRERTLLGFLWLFSHYHWRSVHPVVVKNLQLSAGHFSLRLCFLYPLDTRASILFGRPVSHSHIIISHVTSLGVLKTLCNKCTDFDIIFAAQCKFKGTYWHEMDYKKYKCMFLVW